MEAPDNQLVLMDPSQLDNTTLVSHSMALYHDKGVSYMRPLIFDAHPIERALQNRLQRVQEFPEYEAESIAQHYIDALKEQNPRTLREGDGLDQALNRRGQSAVREGFLKELKLTRIEQILLLRGVVLATNARARAAELNPSRSFSSRQAGLQAVALNAIHHFATNRVHVPRTDDGEKIDKFISDYASAYIAELIEREVIAENQPAHYDVCSVVDAMRIPIPFGRLLSKHHDKRLSIFTIEVGASEELQPPSEFHPRHIIEIDDSRIVELKRLQELLGGTFTSYALFDTVRPIEYIEGETVPDKPDRTVKPPKEPVISEGDQQEEEDYVVLEMSTPDENGRVDTHVVAENATVGHACYALRQEIIDEWERLTGVRFTWQNIFAPRKTTVHQFGAERFVHNPASDVPARVRNYLTQDAETVITRTFGRIFNRHRDKKKELFDDDMNPTEYNRIPALFIQRIQQSEVLKLFWPLIREHGYAQTHTMMRAIARGEATTKVSKPRITRPAKNLPEVQPTEVIQKSFSAEDIWHSIIAAELKQLYEN